MHITPLTGSLGAEIAAAYMRDATQYDLIFAAVARHSVVVIRAQDCAP